jgi:hypothetical protein
MITRIMISVSKNKNQIQATIEAGGSFPQEE